MGDREEQQTRRERAVEAARRLPDDFASWSPAEVMAALTAITYKIKDIDDDEWDEIEKKTRRSGMVWRNLYLKMLAHMKDNAERVEQFVTIVAFTIRRGTRLTTWKKFQNEGVKAEIDTLEENWELKSGAQLDTGDFSPMRILRLSGAMGAFVALKIFGRDMTALHYLATMPFWPSLFPWTTSQELTMAAYSAYLKGAWEKAKLVKCTPPMELNAQWLNNQMFIWKGLWPLEKNNGLCVSVWNMAGDIDNKAYIMEGLDGSIEFTPALLDALLAYGENLDERIRAYLRNVVYVDIVPTLPVVPAAEARNAGAGRRPGTRD